MNRIGPFLAAILLTACEPTQTEAGKNMTQRQRDSAVAASRLPGAQGVGRALQVADSAQARANRLDSIP